jgi:ribose transport system ATP-binding protein
MLSEDRQGEGLAGRLSVSDNLTLSKLEGTGPWRLVTPGGQDRASRRWIDPLAIKCHSPRQVVNTLSGGNQQKVAMARLLHHDVDVLLLDEPTRGIDVGSKAQIYRLIDQLVTADGPRRPRAVLMVSSYLPELLAVCDRIAVMCRGVLSEVRPAADWDEHQLMMMATGRERPG